MSLFIIYLKEKTNFNYAPICINDHNIQF